MQKTPNGITNLEFTLAVGEERSPLGRYTLRLFAEHKTAALLQLLDGGRLLLARRVVPTGDLPSLVHLDVVDVPLAEQLRILADAVEKAEAEACATVPAFMLPDVDEDGDRS